MTRCTKYSEYETRPSHPIGRHANARTTAGVFGTSATMRMAATPNHGSRNAPIAMKSAAAPQRKSEHVLGHPEIVEEFCAS